MNEQPEWLKSSEHYVGLLGDLRGGFFNCQNCGERFLSGITSKNHGGAWCVECGRGQVRKSQGKGYEPIDDGDSDFDKVDFFIGPSGRPKPYCTEHGAMNKVASWEDNEGIWRCLQSENMEDCRAGCIERRAENSRRSDTGE